MEKVETATALAKIVAGILTRGALYRSFQYEGKQCHGTDTHAHNMPKYGALPSEIRMFCAHPRCKQDTWWSTDNSRIYFSTTGRLENRTYTCKNCGINRVYYTLIWEEGEHVNTFIKVGQWPPLTVEPEQQLAKALGEADSGLYKKALINANFNHGIGAIAYFRRVLENKINALIDLIGEAATNAESASADLLKIDEIKGSRRVEDKIEFASKILPPALKPGGHNPLDKLYTAASAGLHGESDGKCLDIFNEARFVFEYLFRNLTVSNEEAREYVKRLSSPPKTGPGE